MSTCEPKDQSKVTGSNEVRTRSGRVSKPPVRYEPVEQVEDDYSDGNYDTDESMVESGASSYTTSDEDDADDDGNLDGFVTSDKSDSDDTDTEDDGKPPVPEPNNPKPKRPIVPVRK